ncbi:hypothetical protein GGR53DRAFT_463799 [Hypoxylon sp. FL1150]|nr:hypothetical protein GGR53DRAFT_463799 [Hypoxylon sp. FL1150]
MSMQMYQNVPTMALRPFVPSEQLTGRPNGTREVSGNYKGDPTLAVNKGTHVADHENTSLWITGLPRKIEYPELLDHIAAFKVGRIRSTVINPPTEKSSSSAATISFFRRSDAERLYSIIEKGELMIRERIPRVIWNRNKVEEDKRGYVSRVLLIAGPAFMTPTWLHTFFSSKFTWQEDTVINHGIKDTPTGPVSRVEWRFASYRSQAQSAYMALDREMKGFGCWEFGVDPCDHCEW